MSQGSHNWTWHIATNDRVLTSGVLMFSDAPNGFEFLPGRLSLDVSDGYMCPIKPAIADGRLFARLSDRLVCYDLRRKRDAQARALRVECRAAVPGVVAALDANVTVRLRLVVGEVGAKWPDVRGPEREQAADWVGSWTSAAAWRATDGAGLAVNEERFAGRTTLRLGWHKEQGREEAILKAFSPPIPGSRMPALGCLAMARAARKAAEMGDVRDRGAQFQDSLSWARRACELDRDFSECFWFQADTLYMILKSMPPERREQTLKIRAACIGLFESIAASSPRRTEAQRLLQLLKTEAHTTP